MNPATLTAILQWMEFGQTVLPKFAAIVSHYATLKDDPHLKETDRMQMAKNLQGLELKDWKDL